MMASKGGLLTSGVLVVGGSGFVGKNILMDLLQHAPEFRVESMSSREVAPEARLPNVTYHIADLSSAEQVNQVMSRSRPSVIIHVASPKPFIHKPIVYEKVNVQGARNLIKAAERLGCVRAYVYTSSVSVIHDGKSDLLMADESAPVLYAPEQKESYWDSKAVAETEILHANRRNGQRMLTTALRVTSIFGADDEQITNAVVKQARQGQLNVQIGDNKNLNDWTYVGNVAYAHRLAMYALLQASASETPAPTTNRVEGEAFFITNDEPRYFWTFAMDVAAAAGCPVNRDKVRRLPKFFAFLIGFISELIVWVTSLGRRKAEINRQRLRFAVITQTFNTEKAKRCLGYRPLVSIDEAIRLSVAPLLEEGAKT